MMTSKDLYRQKCTDATTAVRSIQNGHHVFLNANCGEPPLLTQALVARAAELSDVQVIQLLGLGKLVCSKHELAQHVRVNALFVGPGVRDAVNAGDADYTPIFLSEIPHLFRSGRLPIDVALIQVSAPDEHGYCSFGVSVDIGKPAAECARIVVAEVNQQMPRTLGDAFIHISQLTHIVETDHPIMQLPVEPLTDVHRQIGSHIASLIDDGATLQLGIGAIPNAVLLALHAHRDLGVHTEMFSDGVVDLYEAGVITNARKSLHRGKLVSSFAMGSDRLYRFLDNNPAVEMHPSHYTNDPTVIARNNDMVAINSAISIDLSGQVNADSIGTKIYSGFGGQLDFMRGAARSKGGKPIIALPATAKGQSRIVPILAPGAGVVTTRGDVHYVVTEYGIADLYGKSLRQRAAALIKIAHPDHREELDRFAHQQHLS